MYWGRSQIAQFTGCSFRTAAKVLTDAQTKCKENGKQSLYDKKVYHGYVIEVLGINIEQMEKSGTLDIETNRKAK